MSAFRRYFDQVDPMMQKLWPGMPHHPLSRALGWVAGREQLPPKSLDAAIQAFVTIYGVNLDEAEIPEKGFSSFDEFFTRRLRADARAICQDPGTLIAPADGRVEDAGMIDAQQCLMVKGRSYRVAELLGDEAQAVRYVGGSYAVIYLSPRDYHRVHAPIDGSLRKLRLIRGTLFPVNRLGTTYVPNLFARNERVIFEQESSAYGHVATLMVGAFGVGRIDISFDRLSSLDWPEPSERVYTVNAVPLRRGDELGVFHLGSTAIVMTEAHARFRTVLQSDQTVKLGESLMDRKASS